MLEVNICEVVKAVSILDELQLVLLLGDLLVETFLQLLDVSMSNRVETRFRFVHNWLLLVFTRHL